MDPVIFILLLLLDCGFSRGQDSADMSGKLSLRFTFDPYYNFHEKFCCRFYQNSCAPFVNNRGYAADLYKGRLSIIEYNGLMVVSIWNLQKSDAGGYRCAINGIQFHIYRDYIVTISDASSRQSPPQPSMPSSTRPTKINILTTSATPVESSNVSHSDGYHRFKSNMWIILTAGLTVLVMLILIISVTAMMVHLRKKEKGPQFPR
ncbi:hypothetical protein GJAV_G00192140 [Gymnothorax javanicus]|nr:hypothetical protein GJAV_G00192140 [Gymnothorax javanicus]